MSIQSSGQGPSGAIRCSDCGGLNSAGAEWCGQCLRSFAPPSPPPPPPPAPVTNLEPRQEAIEDYFSELSDPLGPADAAAIVDQFERDPLGIDGPAEHIAPVVPLAAHSRAAQTEPAPLGAGWTCRVCETANDLTADTCAVCGSSFADTMRPPPPPVTGDPNKAALYSLFYPGAGHAYLGQWGQAVARGIMSAWVLLVTGFLLFGASGGGSKIFAAVFSLVATGLWLAAAHDAFREASGQQSQVLLRGRRYLYITGTLVGLLFLMLLGGAATAAS